MAVMTNYHHDASANPLDGIIAIFLPAGADQLQFEAAGRGVEARVQDRAVRLGGAGQDVGAFFDEHDLCAGKRKPAGDGTAHDARADDRDVE